MNASLSSRIRLGLALLLPLAAEGDEWLSIPCWPKPHGWYELISGLETTGVDLYSVTNATLFDALRLASDKYREARGRPLSYAVTVSPDHIIPPVSLTLRQVSMSALYDALASATGLCWRESAAIRFYHPDDDSRLTLWRGAPSPAGRHFFDRLPPRICTHGPRVQIAYLPARNLLMYQDEEDRGTSVMQGLYNIGLITNIEILAKGRLR